MISLFYILGGYNMTMIHLVVIHELYPFPQTLERVSKFVTVSNQIGSLAGVAASCVLLAFNLFVVPKIS